MKKIIAISTLAILASANVHASKARLLALGENLETAGALYFSDNRNIFLNAAYVNEYKDGIYLEWGAEGAANTKRDDDNSPQAEGGFLKSYNNFVYGLHIGGESYITHEARQYLRFTNAGAPGATHHQDNQIDGFFGGESGDVKWGVNATYSNTEDDTNNMKQKSASIRLGAIAGRIEGYANIALMNEAEMNNLATAATNGTDKDEFEGKLGFELGGSYDLNAVKVFGYWRHAGWDQESNTNPLVAGTTIPTSVYQGKAEFKTNRVRVGAGKVTTLNDKAHLFTKLEYVMTKRGVETDDGDADIDDYSVPLTVGLEYDALSWLTLRGSVTQRLISQADNDYDQSLITAGVSPTVTSTYRQGKRSLGNTTDVNAGLTLKFGELSIDGLVGTTTEGGNVTNSTSESGVLSLDNLATRVAMSYRF